jgi:hypothetical protein
MKSRVCLGVLLLAAAINDGRLIACGDKYLSVGFGTHFERTPAERKNATVLVWMPPASNLERTFTDPAVKAGFTKPGYQPLFASSQAELDRAMEGRPPQVIIAEGRHSQDLSQRTKGKSHIVPVLYSPTQDELKQMRRTHETVINTPKKGSTFVDATDDAFAILEIEAEAAAKAADKKAKADAKNAKADAKTAKEDAEAAAKAAKKDH